MSRTHQPPASDYVSNHQLCLLCVVHFLLRQDAMPITADAGVLLPAAAVVAGVLADEHIAMLADPVSLVLRDVVSTIRRLGLGRCPGQVVPPDLNVIVCELAELIVIHAQQFGFLGCAEVETGDVVDAVGDQGGHDEGVGGAGDNVGDLDVQLLPVLVEPAADDDAGVDAVEADDVRCAKQGVEDEADHTGDAVLGENVHGVIDADPVLDCRRWSVMSFRQPLSLKTGDSLLVA